LRIVKSRKVTGNLDFWNEAKPKANTHQKRRLPMHLPVPRVPGFNIIKMESLALSRLHFFRAAVWSVEFTA